MRRLSTLTLLAGLAIATVGLAACGSSSDSGSASKDTVTVTLPSATAGTTELKVESSSLGDIVTDGEGRTLYVFTEDTGTTSNCTGGCATTWPALVAPVTTGEGITGTVAEATQADGATQVTLNGHPLYYYAADAAPGATNGQGVSGKWFVVDGAGNAIKTAPSGSSSGS